MSSSVVLGVGCLQCRLSCSFRGLFILDPSQIHQFVWPSMSFFRD